MTVIALFFPTFISMVINNRYDTCTNQKWESIISRYGIYTLVNVIVTQVTITYLLGVSDVTEAALMSFPFFIKYVIIAGVWATIVPFVEEIIKKCIKVSVRVNGRKEDDEKEN